MLTSIKSKVFSIFGAVVVLFFLTIVYGYFSSKKQIEFLQIRIMELRLPLVYASSNLVAELNLSAAHQRSYLFLYDKEFIKLRERTWSDRIYPLMASLKELKTKVVFEENKIVIDTLAQMLPEYERSQMALTEIVDKNISEGVLSQEGKAEADKLMKSRVMFINNRLMATLKNMSENQSKFVKEEIELLQAEMQFANNLSLLALALILVVISAGSYMIFSGINRSTKGITDIMEELAKGKKVTRIEPQDDELRGVAVSVNVLIEKLDKEVKFAEEVGKGDFYTNFSTGAEDVMGQTLLKMRDNLLTLTQENVSALHESQAQEEELRQQNETMQQIQADLERKTQESMLFNRELADRSEKLNDMIAEMEINKEEMMTIQETLEKKNREMEEAQVIDSHLSALDDMMRLNYDKSVQEFSEIIMFHLCKITNSLRGAMFILDGERLKAVGGYCCTPTTMEKNEFELGENLLAQAAKTKEFIFLNNIPGAAKLKSSLTFIETTNILIAPLVYNEKVQGVLEISGLEAYQSRHTEFAKKACKNIAAMLQNIFSNSQTRKLLIEAQEMSNKLQVQEEETRQMLEESRATQEEMERRNLELNALMNAIQATESYFEIDRDGRIIYANDILLKNLHFSQNELAGKNFEMIVDKLAPRDKNANVALESLLRGYTASGFQLFTAKDGSKKEFWTYFSPVTNREGLVLKIIVAATLA